MANPTTSSSQAVAHGRYIRGSVSKVRRVLDQIRGRSYRDALIMLEFMPYRSTGPITKVLRSAVANAEDQGESDVESLVITRVTVDQGSTLKRWRPRAQGRGRPLPSLGPPREVRRPVADPLSRCCPTPRHPRPRRTRRSLP